MSDLGWTYEEIIESANDEPAFRAGLLAAAEVCRAQGRNASAPCPSTMAAVYIERLANGEMP